MNTQKKQYTRNIVFACAFLVLLGLITFRLLNKSIGATISQNRVVNFISQLRDVTITSPADTEVLTYDSATGKWINATASGGFANPATEDLNMSTNAIIGASNVSSTKFSTARGTVGAPAWTFSADTNTGAYSPSEDEWAWTSGGTQIATANATRIQGGGVGGFYLKRNVGTYAAPTFAFAGNTGEGMGSLSSDNLFFSVLGSKKLEFSSTTADVYSDFVVSTSSFFGTQTDDAVTGSNNVVSTISVCNTASGTCNFTLPDNVTKQGRWVIVADGAGNASANNVTITAAGSDTIEGSGTMTLGCNGQKAMLFAAGGGTWAVLNLYPASC